MPLVNVWCSTPVQDTAKRAFLKETTATVASLLGKGQRWVMVRVSDEESITFGGTADPCCYAEFKSLSLPENRTPEFSAVLSNLIEEHLGVSPDRVYIEFADPPRTMFGFNGSTFA